MIDYKNSGIRGYMTDEDLDWLHQAVLQLPLNAVIVELGSFQGLSAVAIGAACLRTQRQLFCIDKWEGTFPGASGEAIDSAIAFDSFQQNIQRFGLQNHVTSIKGNTVEISATYDRAIDMLFVDAAHFYKDVLADIHAWEPKVKIGGLLCGHDWDRGHCQVNHAVIEVFGESITERQKRKQFAHHIWDLVKDKEYMV